MASTLRLLLTFAMCMFTLCITVALDQAVGLTFNFFTAMLLSGLLISIIVPVGLFPNAYESKRN